VIVAVSSAREVGILARDHGRASGALVRPSRDESGWLADVPSHLPLDVILPNMPQFVRDASYRGFAGAAVLRLQHARLAGWPALAITGVTHLRDVARQDMRGVIPILIELERASLPAAVRRRVRSITLSSMLTDLLLATGHARALGHYVDFVRRRCRVEARLETNNIGQLLRRLPEWHVAPDAVLGPVNARGHRMKPNYTEALAAVRETDIPVIATEVCAAGTIRLEEGVAFALAHGARTAVVEAADLDAR
jgi:hypothetical protein